MAAVESPREKTNQRKRKSSKLRVKNHTDVNDTLKEEKSRSWSEEDIQVLLGRIEDFATKSGQTSQGRRRDIYPKHINWDDVKFNCFTAESCKETWSKLSFRVRKQRTLKEILEDTRVSHDFQKIKNEGKSPVKKPRKHQQQLKSTQI